MPIRQTQPSHLAALAALFGVAAPEVPQARVLELGCASGGNIIPLAVRFPQASFTGIDLSPRHVAEGRARIAAFAAGNVALHCGSLADAGFAGPFDYVVCHGVFSWVPRPVQDAIFRLCQDLLAPDGMAMVSYNVLPGWHLRMAIRDLCRHAAGLEGSPQHRVARARAGLEQAARSANPAEPYGLLLRTEAERLRRKPSAYILGEFLAPDNAPCTVREFIGRAEQHGLRYLCEADLSASVPRALDRAALDSIAGLDSARRAVAEHGIDILTGRPFRQSVLIRSRQDACPSAPDPDRLRELHLAASSASAGTDAAVCAALAQLAQAYPETRRVDELAAAHDVPAVCGALLPMVLAGQASASVLPLRGGRRIPGPAGGMARRAPGSRRRPAVDDQPAPRRRTGDSDPPGHPAPHGRLPGPSRTGSAAGGWVAEWGSPGAGAAGRRP